MSNNVYFFTGNNFLTRRFDSFIFVYPFSSGKSDQDSTLKRSYFRFCRQTHKKILNRKAEKGFFSHNFENNWSKNFLQSMYLFILLLYSSTYIINFLNFILTVIYLYYIELRSKWFYQNK